MYISFHSSYSYNIPTKRSNLVFHNAFRPPTGDERKYVQDSLTQKLYILVGFYYLKQRYDKVESFNPKLPITLDKLIESQTEQKPQIETVTKSICISIDR